MRLTDQVTILNAELSAKNKILKDKERSLNDKKALFDTKIKTIE